MFGELRRSTLGEEASEPRRRIVRMPALCLRQRAAQINFGRLRRAPPQIRNDCDGARQLSLEEEKQTETNHREAKSKKLADTDLGRKRTRLELAGRLVAMVFLRRPPHRDVRSRPVEIGLKGNVGDQQAEHADPEKAAEAIGKIDQPGGHDGDDGLIDQLIVGTVHGARLAQNGLATNRGGVIDVSALQESLSVDHLSRAAAACARRAGKARGGRAATVR